MDDPTRLQAQLDELRKQEQRRLPTPTRPGQPARNGNSSPERQAVEAALVTAAMIAALNEPEAV